MWFLNLLKSLGCSISYSVLHYDNFSTIYKYGKNLIFHHYTKHIETDVYFVHEQIIHHIISLEHISGSAKVVNIYTKFLSQIHF